MGLKSPEIFEYSSLVKGALKKVVLTSRCSMKDLELIPNKDITGNRDVAISDLVTWD